MMAKTKINIYKFKQKLYRIVVRDCNDSLVLLKDCNNLDEVIELAKRYLKEL